MKKMFPYKNLHHYLDLVFMGMDPTPEQVILQKKVYWKAYNTHLKQIQRTKQKQITITLDKPLFEMLLQKSNQKSVPTYIKKVLVEHTQEYETGRIVASHDTVVIEQQFFLVIDYLEALLYLRRTIDKEAVTKLEKILKELVGLLEDKFKKNDNQK